MDDEPAIVEALELTLMENGLEVRTASNGIRALEQIAQWRPDVVLSDWMMPLMDGSRLVQVLRSTPELADIPIFMTSAVHPAINLPIDEFLQKPFAVSRLLRPIQRHMLRRAAVPDAVR
ncbi:response regulator [Caballeronia sp. dw_19]|uniref:response regulator n=1 Tax=Caballeronia sp. dw_19 TaxID=2719791 RepID=UPI001BD65D33